MHAYRYRVVTPNLTMTSVETIIPLQEFTLTPDIARPLPSAGDPAQRSVQGTACVANMIAVTMITGTPITRSITALIAVATTRIFPTAQTQ
jgi:hypothetical protein